MLLSASFELSAEFLVRCRRARRVAPIRHAAADVRKRTADRDQHESDESFRYHVSASQGACNRQLISADTATAARFDAAARVRSPYHNVPCGPNPKSDPPKSIVHIAKKHHHPTHHAHLLTSAICRRRFGALSPMACFAG